MQQKEKDISGVYYIKSGMELSSPFSFLEKKDRFGKIVIWAVMYSVNNTKTPFLPCCSIIQKS